jgi:hypothetical protein
MVQTWFAKAKAFVFNFENGSSFCDFQHIFRCVPIQRSLRVAKTDRIACNLWVADVEYWG